MSQKWSILYLYLTLLVVNTEKNDAIKVTHVVGDEMKIRCDLRTYKGGKIVWKTGPRVLFAGNIRIR